MTQKKSYLKSIWDRSQSVWDELKQKRAFASLKNQAEGDLLNIQSEIIQTEEKIESAVRKSLDDKNWKSIRLLALERDVKKKELDSACKVYREFFSCDPTELINIEN